MSAASEALWVGEGVELRCWRAEDLAALVRHADDAEVAQHTSHRFPHPYTVADGERFLAACERPSENQRNLAIAVDGEACGGISATAGQRVDRHTAELGYWLGRAAWGRGVMTAVVGCFAPWAMAELRLHRLFARVNAPHRRSIRVLEKNGFEFEGRMRCAAVKHGELIDVLLFARVRERLDD